jgi:DNA-binding MarR family transcriptional regulator
VKEGLKDLRRAISVDIPLQQVIILLEVAAQPGITQGELSERVQMSPSSISRSMRMLSKFCERDADKEKGYGLVETRPDLRDRHRQACFLSEKGKALIHEFNESISHT